ncbi:uncharacterized protein EI97DRAFT_147630 [Westerdykella ornata]|uniref:Uncharacterized protein n=1 Tax=Westerdykella ornata TaxID=318751 RepID=A0A6A6JCA4_WESOR|nr:uncharacterized protein EI97DRAFT_147630 [Westerdykella ornata]KAF2273628.1 hypothetical protein EI97DRAFT_147630 [Westerdykella ornata]
MSSTTWCIVFRAQIRMCVFGAGLPHQLHPPSTSRQTPRGTRTPLYLDLRQENASSLTRQTGTYLSNHIFLLQYLLPSLRTSSIFDLYVIRSLHINLLQTVHLLIRLIPHSPGQHKQRQHLRRSTNMSQSLNTDRVQDSNQNIGSTIDEKQEAGQWKAGTRA